jgi:hypothetical protein
MVETTDREMISRRGIFSILGIAAAMAVGVPILMPLDAEAQTAGMERRQDRRMGRTVRRTVRRGGRAVRRTGRTMRRAVRRNM